MNKYRLIAERGIGLEAVWAWRNAKPSAQQAATADGIPVHMVAGELSLIAAPPYRWSTART